MKIQYFQTSSWARESAKEIQHEIDKFIVNTNTCNVMLTGGKSASLVYREWAILQGFQCAKSVKFFLTDERIVSENNANSNSRIIKDILFSGSNSIYSHNFKRIDLSRNDLNIVTEEYEKLLPEEIDILILSVGIDGHIASLFLDTSFQDVAGKKMIVSSSDNHPFKRITITAGVIKKAKVIFVLANGIKKYEIMMKVMTNSLESRQLPASLVRKAIWITDIRVPL